MMRELRRPIACPEDDQQIPDNCSRCFTYGRLCAEHSHLAGTDPTTWPQPAEREPEPPLVDVYENPPWADTMHDHGLETP